MNLLIVFYLSENGAFFNEHYQYTARYRLTVFRKHMIDNYREDKYPLYWGFDETMIWKLKSGRKGVIHYTVIQV